MAKLRVQNLGPIVDSGWFTIKKVTVFTGDQGSGKSTIAKVYSTFSWIEKALFSDLLSKKFVERKSRLKNTFINYHRLENYFQSDTKIEYLGLAYTLIYENDEIRVTPNDSNYKLPQIMYVPAERNFLAYFKTKELKISSPSLTDFDQEFSISKNSLKGKKKLPINDIEVEYDKLNDVVNLIGESYKLQLTEASSGYQSFVPLFLVSDSIVSRIKQQNNLNGMTRFQKAEFSNLFLQIIDDPNMTEQQKRLATSALSSRFIKERFINIVEEPEQNLFPTSQRKMLFNLLTLNNALDDNILLITTHSPYIVNELTLIIKAHEVARKIGESDISKIGKIIPIGALVGYKDVAIYEVSANNGNVKGLKNVNGLPSDKNFLNESLNKLNESFDSLIKISLDSNG